MQLAFSVRAKGGAGLVARAGTIVERFGVTPNRTVQALHLYGEITDEAGGRPTLPITASVLGRHPELVRRFSDQGFEFALHGLVHNDHAPLGLEEQRASMRKGLSIFAEAGVPCVGFRGPYLRFNDATDTAIDSLGLKYHSSQAVLFSGLPKGIEKHPRLRGYELALKLYTPLDADRSIVRPRHRGRLVSIPVALPDDEIMVDRLELCREAQTAAWMSILDRTWKTGELFTIQLHPERIFAMADTLRAVLRDARRRQPAIWIPRLDELADWWERRRAARLVVRPVDGGRYSIKLIGPPEATLLIRDASEAPSREWVGRDRIAVSPEIEIDGPVRPVVGVSPRTPERIVTFLQEEGYPVERCDDRRQVGAFLDVPDDVPTHDQPDERAIIDTIERSAGPLVRLWRWPAGARSALAVTGDIDSITLQDFALRIWETRGRANGYGAGRSR